MPERQWSTSFWSCNKVPQTEWLKQQKFMVSQFRRLQVWDPGTGRAVLPLKRSICSRPLALALPDSSWCSWAQIALLMFSHRALPVSKGPLSVKGHQGFPGGSVDKNANAGDMGSIPGPGRLHIPWSNWAWALQLLNLCSGARELRLLGPSAKTTEVRALEPVIHRRNHCNRKTQRSHTLQNKTA